MLHVVIPLVIVGALPFALTLASKIGAFSRRDNHRTREWQAGLDGYRKRAVWAMQNAFETYPHFVAAVLCAHLAAPGDGTAATLAWAHVATRIAYAACYLGDWARARTLVWYASMASIVGLFVVALTT